MRAIRIYFHSTGLRDFSRDERGMTLLEVLLSTVVLGIALTGFLMALSTATTTAKMSSDENQLVYLAGLEFEALRGAKYADIPFVQTGMPTHVEDVPDYFKDIAISNHLGGDAQIIASGDLTPGDLSTVTVDYLPDLAFDGKRANNNSRWMGSVNDLAWQDSDSGPHAGGPSGGSGGPNAGGPGGGPNAGGNFAPSNFQYIYAAFPKLTKISRILYDSRFNVTELIGAPAGDFDYLPHNLDVWQKDATFFWSDTVKGNGDIYDPWTDPPQPLKFFNDNGYGSSGIWTVFDNASDPLNAGIIGLYGIDTYGDFDKNFHWPYASEIEVYGFSSATNYVEVAGDASAPQYNNVIMYFPNYMGSGFDVGRHVYSTASSVEAARAGTNDLIWVELRFFSSSRANLDETWQKTTWWDPRTTNELARFTTSFYRDTPTRIDNLPNLHALPQHRVYGDNEDLKFPFTIPGATAIRAHFSVFDLEPNPGTDEATVEDPAGTVYSVPPLVGPGYANDFQDKWTDWVPGDTIVIHFKSNGSLNSYDSNYQGFVIDSVEMESGSTG